jgi:hypothetical protein
MAPPTPPPSLAPMQPTSSPLYLTGEDVIRLTAFNSATGVTLELRGRFLPVSPWPTEAPPRVGAVGHALVPTSDRLATTRTAGLGEGWLLDWGVDVTAGTPQDGQCFVQVALARGQGGAVIELSPLGSGYVTDQQRLGWPDGRVDGFLAGGGALRSITGTIPGAGAEVSEVVPTGARWALLALELDLVTAVAVANRVPQLTIDDGVTVFARVSVNQNLTASLTWRNSFQRAVPQLADLTRFVITTPIGADLQLRAGYRLRTVTAAIQAADQYSAPQYLVQEWIEGV